MEASGRFDAGFLASLAELRFTGEGEALIRPVMRQGRRLAPAEDLEALRERAREQLANLPPALRELNSPADYPVRDTAGLRRLAKELDEPGR